MGNCKRRLMGLGAGGHCKHTQIKECAHTLTVRHFCNQSNPAQASRGHYIHMKAADCRVPTHQICAVAALKEQLFVAHISYMRPHGASAAAATTPRFRSSWRCEQRRSIRRLSACAAAGRR